MGWDGARGESECPGWGGGDSGWKRIQSSEVPETDSSLHHSLALGDDGG